MNRETLEGRRLSLRAPTDADAEALAEAVETSRIHLKRRFRWASTACAAADERAWLARAAAEAETGRGAVWGAFDRRDGRLVGVVSLHGREPLDGAMARVSFWVRAQDQDKGCATEAGKLLVEHAFRRLGAHRLWARIDPANRAARRVLQRLGFRYEGCLRAHKRLNGRWVDQECWGLLKGEWKR